MKITVKRQGYILHPVFESDIENIKKIPENEEFDIEHKKKRNSKFHRKFFALMKLAFDNQEAYKILDIMRKDIIKHAGYVDVKTNYITGEITEEAKSISFANMDDHEFSELYESCKIVISNWLGIENNIIDEEIQQHF